MKNSDFFNILKKITQFATYILTDNDKKTKRSRTVKSQPIKKKATRSSGTKAGSTKTTRSVSSKSGTTKRSSTVKSGTPKTTRSSTAKTGTARTSRTGTVKSEPSIKFTEKPTAGITPSFKDNIPASTENKPAFKYSSGYEPQPNFSDPNKPVFKYSYRYGLQEVKDPSELNKADNNSTSAEILFGLKEIYEQQYSKYLTSFKSHKYVMNKIFVAEASYIQDITYKTSKTSSLQYLPSLLFSTLKPSELQYYLYWRTNARSEKFKFPNMYCLELYLAEIMNNIRNEDNDKLFVHLLKLTKFILTSETYLNNTDDYVHFYKLLRKCVICFYFFHEVKMPRSEINELLPSELGLDFNEYEPPTPGSYAVNPAILNNISKYKFLKSKFYESQYGFLLPKAIDYVFKNLEKYFSGYNYNFFEIVFSGLFFSQVSSYQCFDTFMYYNEDRQLRNKEISFANGEKYKFTDGMLWSYTLASSNYYNEIVGYLIKTIEADLRQYTGYKPQIKAKAGPIYESLEKSPFKDNKTQHDNLKQFLDLITYIDTYKFIHKTLEKFWARQSKIMSEIGNGQKNSEPSKQETEQTKQTVVEIDTSKFRQIRDESSYLQQILVVEEESDEKENTPDRQDTPEENAMPDPNITNQTDSNQSDLMSNFDEIEMEAIKIIVSGENIQPQLNALAMKHNLMPEIIIEKINEKALNIINDNLIDNNDIPFIYDEYIDEINKEE